MPPPTNDILTDEYVAELLVNEAQDYSLRYSTLGLDANKPARRPGSQPKPNTRFLNNIIRDTDSHNRALLAKESAESQARLRELEHEEQTKRDEAERKSRRSVAHPSDTRKRMLGDMNAILSGSSRKRMRTDTESARPRSSDHTDSAHERSSVRSHRHSGKESESTVKGRDRELFPESSHSSRRLDHRHDRSPRRSRSPGDQRRRHRERSPRRRDRDRSRGCYRSEREGRKDRDHSPRRRDRNSSKDRHHSAGEPREERRREAGHLSPQDSSDSDPLAAYIPKPPKLSKDLVQPRGRGANSTASGIDGRFASDYDPKADIKPSSDSKGVWDDEVEAFRDRQKLKAQGAERLRSAGFTEEQIRKWEKGGEKDEADVRWAKQGGVREWDQGKVVSEDGSVSLKAGWTRSTDS